MSHHAVANRIKCHFTYYLIILFTMPKIKPMMSCILLQNLNFTVPELEVIHVPVKHTLNNFMFFSILRLVSDRLVNDLMIVV